MVEESNLTRNISTLRKALSAHSGDPQYIETIPWRGYRFVADVREVWDGNGGLIEAERAYVQGTSEDQGPAFGNQENGEAFPHHPLSTRPEAGTGSALASEASGSKSIIRRLSSRAKVTGPVRPLPLVAMLSAVLLVAGIITAVLIRSTDRTRLNASEVSVTSETMQVTTWPGLDFFPTLSPDGSSVAYSSDHDGRFEIYVKQFTPGAREIQITSDGQQTLVLMSANGSLVSINGIPYFPK